MLLLVVVDLFLEYVKEDFFGFFFGEFISFFLFYEVFDYYFGFEEGEGIRDFFDCDFGDLIFLDF